MSELEDEIDEKLAFLSSHPLSKDRVEHMKSLLPAAWHIRQLSDCRPLS